MSSRAFFLLLVTLGFGLVASDAANACPFGYHRALVTSSCPCYGYTPTIPYDCQPCGGSLSVASPCGLGACRCILRGVPMDVCGGCGGSVIVQPGTAGSWGIPNDGDPSNNGSTGDNDDGQHPGGASGLPIARYHLVVALDSAEDLKSSLIQTKEVLESVVYRLESVVTVEADFLEPSDVSRDIILDRIRELDVQETDGVFVWISSHGKEEDGKHLFTLDDGTSLLRDDLVSAISEKNPFCGIVISDACAKGLDLAEGTRAVLQSTQERTPEEVERLKKYFTALFVQQRGILDVNSCAINQKAWLDGSKTAFAEAFRKHLFETEMSDVDANQDGLIDWETESLRVLQIGLSEQFAEIKDELLDNQKWKDEAGDNLRELTDQQDQTVGVFDSPTPDRGRGGAVASPNSSTDTPSTDTPSTDEPDTGTSPDEPDSDEDLPSATRSSTSSASRGNGMRRIHVTAKEITKAAIAHRSPGGNTYWVSKEDAAATGRSVLSDTGNLLFGEVYHTFWDGDLAQAKSFLNLGLDRSPRDARLWYYRGLIAIKEGRRDQAADSLARAIELEIQYSRQHGKVLKALERVQGTLRLELLNAKRQIENIQAPPPRDFPEIAKVTQSR